MATALLLDDEASLPAGPAGPFHLSAAWARCWADAYGEGEPTDFDVGEARLRMVLRRERAAGLGYRLLAGATNLQTCYFDLEGPAPPDDALAALPRRLLATGAAQVRIDWLAEPSPLLEAARAWRGRHLVLVEPFALSPLADCREGFDGYLAGAGSTVRKLWRACRRQVLDGPLDFRIVTGGPGLGALLDEMFALEAAGWKGRSGTAILCDGRDSRFYRDLAFAAEAAGALRIAALREEGRLIAYEYCVVGGDSLLAMKVGYDESRGRIQPGHLAALMNIRAACADPAIAWYDMLGNSMRVADYKRRFATGTRTLFRIRLFARTPLGRALHALYRARPLARRLRERLGRLGRRRSG